MSAQDASFLRFESECCHMQIAAIAIFEGPPPSQAEIKSLVTSRLDRVPRFRQKIRFVPFELGHPVWVDDEDFELKYHLQRTAIPQPGSMKELHHLVGRLMSKKLDRARPLWEMWIIEGLAEDRWVILSKTHHCLADGESEATLLTSLLELNRSSTSDIESRTESNWESRPNPGRFEMAAHAVASGIRAPRKGLRSLGRSLSTPRRALSELGDFVEGLASFRSLAGDSVVTALNGPVGPHRRWCSAHFSLADVKQIGSRYEATVNDVLLASVATGFRLLLLSRGEAVVGRVVRSLVPVSLRHGASGESVGNRVALMLIDLPVDFSDPVECLQAVHREMVRRKERHQSDATAALVSLSAYSPPFLLALGGRFFREIEQESIQTVTTNVVGPPVPLYFAGREMLSVYPYVPLSSSVRIGIAIASYAGEIGIGVTGDYESAPDIEVLANAIEENLKRILSTI